PSRLLNVARLMHNGRMRFIHLASLMWVLAAPVTAQLCPGDCDGDNAISAAEFAQVIGGVFDAAICPAADRDGDAAVDAADVLAAHRALGEPPEGCQVDEAPASTWLPLPALPGGARQEIGVAALGTQVYVIGGLTDTGQGVAAVEVFDTVGGTWTTTGGLPRPLHHIGTAALDGQLYSVGGFIRQSFSPATDVSRYDPTSGEWTAVAPLPAPRGALAVAVRDGLLYASGGSGPGGSVAEHSVYDPQTDRWSPLAALPTPRNHLASVALGDYVYVIGGRSDGGGNANSAALDRYDPATDTWDALAPMPTARSGHAAAVLDGLIVVMGGEVNSANPPNFVFDQVERYDPALDEWTTLAPMAAPRHGIGAATVGGLIYVPGGATRAGFAATAHHDALRIVR
ncbi:MAG: Kelch repeat-containing protein, partial [Candidatus Binatia bacterium]